MTDSKTRPRLAVIETLVALAIIFGFARNMTGSSDIGAANIYAVVSMGLLALCYYAGTRRYRVDFYIEQRVSWWWKVAEVGRAAPIAPTPSTVIPVPDSPADLGSVDLANATPKQPAMQ